MDPSTRALRAMAGWILESRGFEMRRGVEGVKNSGVGVRQVEAGSGQAWSVTPFSFQTV